MPVPRLGSAGGIAMKPASCHLQGAVSPGEDRHKITVQRDKPVVESLRESEQGNDRLPEEGDNRGA